MKGEPNVGKKKLSHTGHTRFLMDEQTSTIRETTSQLLGAKKYIVNTSTAKVAMEELSQDPDGIFFESASMSSYHHFQSTSDIDNKRSIILFQNDHMALGRNSLI